MYFIHIKPNSNKDFDANIVNQVYKELNSTDNLLFKHDNIDDLVDIVEDYIVELNNNEPIVYISNILKNYDILPINKSNNKYNLLIVSSRLNNPHMLATMSDEEKQQSFNLVCSSLVQFYNKNQVIFGDAFIINIDSTIYNKIMSDQSEQSTNIEIDNSIYFNYKFIDLFQTIADIHYIQIYVKPLNKTVLYSRNIINLYLEQNKPKEITDSIISIEYDSLILYIKYTEILPESHNHILRQTTNQDLKYLTNILNEDIVKIINL